MVKEFVKAWDDHKEGLRNYIATTGQEGYGSYTDLFRLVIKHVLNKAGHNFSTDVDVLDHGDYQGTLILIAHVDTYQPYSTQYIYTGVYYGSCSYCDTLQSIKYDGEHYGSGLPNNEQVEDYMTLCLHMLQQCRWFYGHDEEDE